MKKFLVMLCALAACSALTACSGAAGAAASGTDDASVENAASAPPATESALYDGSGGDLTEAERAVRDRQLLEERLANTLLHLDAVTAADVSLAADGVTAEVTIETADSDNLGEAQLDTIKS